MKLSKLRFRKPNNLVLAYCIPFVSLLMLMIIAGAVPFGNKSLLYSDMWHQYFPFFKAYRQAILNGDSLLFNWNVGMGVDYLGMISYYLASPLNLISILLPDSWVLPYFSLLLPIKLGFASLFFAIFLKKLFHKDDLSIALFGSFYALCAWALGYQWNTMWLDTFALLPLVALGTVYLLRDKKFILYTVTLTLSILINYYIGFFTCIFVLLLFICYQICRCRSIKRFFQDLGRIALFSVLAIGMTAILTLPALSALGNTYSSINTFPEDFALNMVDYDACTAAREAWQAYKTAKEAGDPSLGLWFTALGESFGPVLDGMGQVAGNLSGGLTPTYMDGLPNVYTGVGVLMLAFLFLMAGNIKLRDKLCCLFMVLFLMVSFVIRQLDYIWHGFHFPNMIPYRFSFILSFVLLYMAYRAYLVRHRFRPLQFVLAALLTLEIFLFSEYADKIPSAVASLQDVFRLIGESMSASAAGNQAAVESAAVSLESLMISYEKVYIYLAFNAVFLLLYLAVLIYPSLRRITKKDATAENRRRKVLIFKSNRRLCTGLLLMVLSLELVMNVINFGTQFTYTDLTDYPQGTENTESMIRYMKEREEKQGTLFYRAETTHTQTLNDGALNDYNGISIFSSSTNVKATRFMTKIGFASQDNWNRFSYEESSPVANLFLNLKYMIERNDQVESNNYFTDVHSFRGVHLLENNAYLPLGFLAESQLADAELFDANSVAFYNQNLLFSAATGIRYDVWNRQPDNWLTITGSDVDVSMQPTIGYCTYSTSTGGTVTYKYEIQREGFLCLDVNLYARNYFYVYVNDEYLFGDSVVLPQMFSVCQVNPGDVVEVRVSCSAGENSGMYIQAALLEDEVFRQGYEILNASTLNLTEFTSTEVAGTIRCNRDGLLYTSIPDNGNWTAYVDGNEAEIQLVGDAMIGVMLTEGEHEVRFVYRNDSFLYGNLITLFCLLAFLGIIYWSDREKWNERALRLYGKFRKKGGKKTRK